MTGMQKGGKSTGLQVVVISSLIVTISALPVFLLSAVAVLVRAELAFDEAGLGLAVSLYFAVAALGAVPTGYVVQQLGGRRSLGIGAVISAVALAGVAATWSWGALLVCMVLGGLGNTMSSLAATERLAGTVPSEHQGLAFGIKQSAIPFATLAGGAAVPTIALSLGWRWVFLVAAVIAFVVGGFQLSRSDTAAGTHRYDVAQAVLGRRPLVVLGIAVAFGSASMTALAAFVVEYGVVTGVEPGTAGLVLAISSFAAVAARVGLGWLADYRRGRRNLLLVAGMLTAGGLAVAGLPLISTWLPLMLLLVLAYAVGSGWQGLFNLTIVRGNPQAPAAAMGVPLVGVYAGGMVGPLAFGLVLTRFGYASAWAMTAAWMLSAAVLMLIGRRSARRVWSPSPGDPVRKGR